MEHKLQGMFDCCMQVLLDGYDTNNKLSEGYRFMLKNISDQANRDGINIEYMVKDDIN